MMFLGLLPRGILWKLLKTRHFCAIRWIAAPKALAMQNLDKFSRKYCPNLDHFVAFSSIVCGRGNSEQTNYGWANAVMERICEQRVADGLPGLAIQWGVIGQVGLVAEKIFKGMHGSQPLLGMIMQNVESVLEALDVALQHGHPVVSSMIVADKSSQRGQHKSLLKVVSRIFGIENLESLNPDKKLTELGMDSLVGVELKQALERDYDLNLTREQLLSFTVGDIIAIDSGGFSMEGRGGQGLVLIGGPPVSFPFRIHEEILKPMGKNLRTGGKYGDTAFFVHGLEGSVEALENLARMLPWESYGFQYDTRVNYITVESLALSYIQRMREVQPKGPYTILGYSGGGMIAYEMAIQLEDIHSENISNLVFLDGQPCVLTEAFDSTQQIMKLAESSKLFVGPAEEDNRRKFQDKLCGDTERDVVLLLDTAASIGGLDYDRKLVAHYVALLDAFIRYQPRRKYSGKTVAILPAGDDVAGFSLSASRKTIDMHCIGSLSKIEVAGDHTTFLEENNVAETAEKLLSGLMKA